MLTIASRLDVMNRLGRAMADGTRSRILLSLLEKPGYPAQLARNLELTRTNVSNHLACLRACGIVVAIPEGRRTRYEIADPHITRALESLMDAVLMVDESQPCVDDCCVPHRQRRRHERRRNQRVRLLLRHAQAPVRRTEEHGPWWKDTELMFPITAGVFCITAFILDHTVSPPPPSPATGSALIAGGWTFIPALSGNS